MIYIVDTFNRYSVRITIFSILSSDRSIRTNWNLQCWAVISIRSFYGLNTTYSASKSISNLNCVFISYTLQKLCYYNANYNKNIVYENGFLNVFSIGNLLNSCTLWQYCTSAKEWKCAVKMSTQKFSTQVFTTKDRCIAFFRCVSCQKHIKMNIEWIRMAIPVLISNTLTWSFDNTVYRSRPVIGL